MLEISYDDQMRKWIGLVLLAAMVVTTTIPAASHAAMKHKHGGNASVPAQALKAHDCQHSANQAAQKNDTHPDKACCQEGMCKCVGGSCHNISKYFGNQGNSVAVLSASSLVFAFSNQFVDSPVPNRLKRPPKG